jgi:flagellar basal body-associated protein FliL
VSSEPTSRAHDALIEELRDAVGDEAVERADLDVERAVRGRAKTPEASRSRLLFAVIGAAGVVVAAAAALALESWVVFGVAIVLHAIGTAIVVTVAFRATTDVEKPGPTKVAMLEHEGVDDPEGALNQLVEQASSRDEGGRAARAAAQPSDRTDQTASQADEVARQQESYSPGSNGAT